MIAFLLLFGVGPLPVPPPMVGPPLLTGPIRDHIKMFSESAQAAAVKRITELEKEHGYELIVETIEEQPSTSEFSGLLYQTNRNAYLRDWAIKRARAAGIQKGVYVVISRSPRDIRVVPFPEDLGSKFTPVKLGRMRRKLQQYIASNPDRALADGLATYADLLDRARESSSPLATVPLLAIVGGQIGVWLVLLIFRRRIAPADEALYPPAVQGSLFGTPAAGWIYDRMYIPPSSAPAAAAVQRGTVAPDAIMPSQPSAITPPRPPEEDDEP